MDNKRGLSDVVTTVLIILLVIVAIGTIWTIVQKPIKNTEGQASKSNACSNLIISPVKCQAEKVLKHCESKEIINYEYRVTYKRNENSAEGISISNLKAVMTKGDSTAQVQTLTGPGYYPVALQTKSAVVQTDSPLEVRKFSISPTLKSSSGQDIICPESAKVNCNIPSNIEVGFLDDEDAPAEEDTCIQN